MKSKNINLLVTIAVSLCLLLGSIAVINFVLKSRRPGMSSERRAALAASTHPAQNTRLEVSTVPAQLQAGKSAIWSLKIVDRKKLDRHGKPKYIRSYTQDLGNLVNLVIASQDLSFFHRPRLDYKDYGHFMFNATLPRAGQYRLYADYKPYQQQSEAPQHKITVLGGLQAAPQEWVDDVIKDDPNTKRSVIRTKSVGGYTISLLVNAHADEKIVANSNIDRSLKANEACSLSLQISESGSKVLADLDSYFGAAARCDIFSSDGKEHWSLASLSSDDLVFTTRFQRTGWYKLWVQFQHKGKVVQVPFSLNVLRK